MRKFAGAMLGLGLALGGAGCGVDTEGATESLIESTEAALGEELTEDQKECLEKLIEEYSDGDLRALADRTAGEPLRSEFVEKQYGCLVTLGS